MDWLQYLVLGAVQGLTEFLPISSDGHLIVAEQAFEALGLREATGKENLFVNVMLHLGTLVAILLYYRAVILTGARGLLGDASVPPSYQRPSQVLLAVLVVLATLPAVGVGLFLKDRVEQATDSPMAAGYGFLVTAAVLAVTPRFKDGPKGPSQTTPMDALLIGVAQAIAILPGVSRSGMTIAAALLLGLNRSWAVGFSLLMAVPAILGASVLVLKDLDPSTVPSDRAAQILAATVLAGAIGFGAIVWLIRIVRRGRLWYFSVYLVLLAAVVLTGFAMRGDRSHVRPKNAVERPDRDGDGGLGGVHPSGRGAVDRADAGRPVAGRAHAGEAAMPVSSWAERADVARPLG